MGPLCTSAGPMEAPISRGSVHTREGHRKTELALKMTGILTSYSGKGLVGPRSVPSQYEGYFSLDQPTNFSALLLVELVKRTSNSW